MKINKFQRTGNEKEKRKSIKIERARLKKYCIRLRLVRLSNNGARKKKK
jgi:hypothetical protein